MAALQPAAPLPAPPRRRRPLPGWLSVILGLEVALLAGVALGLGMTSEVSPLIVSIAALVVYTVLIVVSPVAGMAFWLVLYPFAETRINIPLGQGIADLSPTRVVMGLLLVMLAAQVAIRRRPLPRIHRLDLWAGLFAMGIGLSALASSDPIASLKAVLDSFVMPLVLYFVARQFIVARPALEGLFNALLIIGAYTAFLALLETATGIVWLRPTTSGSTTYEGGIRILRSLWGTNTIFGSIFCLVIPIGFYRLLESRTPLARLGYSTLTLIYLVSMFFTYKRGAWIAMVISFAILFVLYPASRRLLIVLALVVSVPLAVFWNRVAASNLVENRITYQADTLNGRTDRWVVALDLWQQSPILGVGFNRFDELSGYIAIENHYLQILVSGGLFAFIPFVVFWLGVLYIAFRRYLAAPPGSQTRVLMALFLALMSTYLVKGLSGAHATAVNLMVYALVGALLGWRPAPEQLVLAAERSAGSETSSAWVPAA